MEILLYSLANFDGIVGLIDCSKVKAEELEVIACSSRFAEARQVYSVLTRVANLLGIRSDDEFEDFYGRTAWYLDEQTGRKCGVFKVFKDAAS